MKYSVPLITLRILSTLLEAGFQAYIVGGAVRDLLQKKKVKDWDFTTDAVPQKVLSLFQQSFYDNKFGTVMVAGKHLALQYRIPILEWRDSVFDITTFRTEFGYSDRRRPDVVKWGKSIHEDLSRRDFTINAMALKPKFVPGKKLAIYGQIYDFDFDLIDPFSGKLDLNHKLIRTVGDPNKRFLEDALRMMRAIRIGSQLTFLIEEKTLQAIRNNSALLKDISRERIRDEFLKIIGSDYPADGVLLLHTAGLLDYILPELVQTRGIPQAGHHIYDVWTHSVESLRNCPSSQPIVRLAALLHDIGKAITFKQTGDKITFYNHEVVGARLVSEIAERLKLSKHEKEKLFTLVRWHMFSYDPKTTDSAIRRFIRRVGRENINDMLLLRVGDRKGGGSKATSWRLQEFQERIGEQLYEPLTLADLKVNGLDIMKVLKIEPGPKVGKILKELFEEVMENSAKNEREHLLKRAKELE